MGMNDPLAPLLKIRAPNLKLGMDRGCNVGICDQNAWGIIEVGSVTRRASIRLCQHHMLDLYEQIGNEEWISS